MGNEASLSTALKSPSSVSFMHHNLVEEKCHSRATSAKSKKLPYLFETKYQSYVESPYIASTTKEVQQFINDMVFL